MIVSKLYKKTWKKWTDQDDIAIKRLISNKLSYQDISKQMNRPINSIKNRLITLNLEYGLSKICWTDEEEKIIKEKYMDMGNEDLGKLLNRSRYAVANKIIEMDLARDISIRGPLGSRVYNINHNFFEYINRRRRMHSV